MKNGTTSHAPVAQAPGSIPFRSTPAYRRGVLVEHESRLDQELAARWMADNARSELKKQQCVQYLLSHRTEKGLEPVTQTTTIDRAASPEQRLEVCKAFALELDRASWEWAQEYPRKQSFVISGFTRAQEQILGDGGPVDEAARCAFPFSVTPPPDVASQFHQRDPEKVSDSASIGHMARLLDQAIRQSGSNMQHCMDRVVDQNRDLLGTVDKLLSRNLEYAERLEASLDAQSLRNVQAKQAEVEVEIKSKLVEALGTFGIPIVGALGSHVAKRFAEGREVKRAEQQTIRVVEGQTAPAELSEVSGPTEPPRLDEPVRVAAAGSAELVTFSESLEPEQLAAIWKDLNEEQREKFKPLLKTMAGSMPAEKQMRLATIIMQQKEGA